jgi:hypothetical protein
VPGGGSWCLGGTWRSQSCPVPGGGSWGHGTRDGPRAVVSPGGGSWSHEARSGSGATLCQETRATGHADMCALLVFHLDLELVRGGYPVFKVPTVAPGPTPGEAANPWVGPASFPMQPF